MWLRHGKFMANNSSGSVMGLSLHSLSDEVLYMTTFTGVRLQRGSKVGICTSAPLQRCLCCTAVGLLCSLCPVVNKSVPHWQIPHTNGTSSRFVELLALIQLGDSILDPYPRFWLLHVLSNTKKLFC